jgi:hypothetical protein
VTMFFAFFKVLILEVEIGDLIPEVEPGVFYPGMASYLIPKSFFLD